MNISIQSSADLKLYMLLLGSKAPNRNVEQHDYFFGIGRSLKELVPAIKAFWPEAGDTIHIDGWREVSNVEGYQVKVVLKEEADLKEDTAGKEESDLDKLIDPAGRKLFFINLGGYQADKLEEQHYTVLTVQEDRAMAIKEAKKTVFFKTNSIKGANSHIDEKYGVDVDDIYRIEEILSTEHKEKYQIRLSAFSGIPEDQIHLGYLKLDKL